MKVKPCPYCKGDKIGVTLRSDCYSSWAEVCCKQCGAETFIGTDKNEHDTFPNPKRNWKAHAIKFWNLNTTSILKKQILELKRGVIK